MPRAFLNYKFLVLMNGNVEKTGRKASVRYHGKKIKSVPQSDGMSTG